MKYLYLLILAAGISISTERALASDSTRAIPPGTVYGRIYSNFHTEVNAGDNATAFEIRRAYFGYQKELGSGFSAEVKLDIGSPEDLSEFSLIRRYAYFKNALLKYRKQKLTVNFGIIDMLHFKLQEKIWAHRYIEKSFADNYRFGFSADLGAQAIYEFTDWLSADFTLSNGEGYTRLQTDNTYRSALGITILPGDHIITRLYYDYAEKNTVMTTASAFLGYRIEDKILTGVEYHYRSNENFAEKQDMYGYSAYASWYITGKWQLFGRYDEVSSNFINDENIPWNLADDGSKIIAGIEYSPIDAVKLALNYQDWFPYANNEPNEQFIYLNVEVRF